MLFLSVANIINLNTSVIKVSSFNNLQLDYYDHFARSSINIIPYERQALHDLYISTNGNDWVYQEESNKGYWNFTNPNVNPCLSSNKWQGLNCTIIVTSTTDSYYYISKIILPKYNLNGFIPYSIGNFSQLQYLDLSYNYINKEIPTTIGNLSELVLLNISFNELTGSIPTTIENLISLKNLSLDGNQISGTIPDEIGELLSLVYLNLSSNHLNNTIPVSLSNLTKISTLGLANNKLSGSMPAWIGELSELMYLNLSTNQLHSMIPVSLSNLSYLKTLSINSNQLYGTLPSEIGYLSELIYLGLNHNKLNGTIPNMLCNLRKLIVLSINDNELSGTIPYNIGNLSSLESLILSTNRLHGTVPASISNLTNISCLILGNNKLLGTIPYWIGELSKLRILNIGSNQFHGSLPISISYLTDLKVLSVGYNKLTGTIPDWISNLSELIFLGLSDNQFKGTLPVSFSLLLSLRYIALSHNILSGILPDEFIEKIANLTFIKLNNNNFIGTIPRALSRLSSLQSLHIQNNHFTGNLNRVFNASYQTKLNNIRLSNNQFTGKLPEEAFQSKSLTEFSAVSNCFHGSIPSSICDNTQLETLALDGLVCASSCRNKLVPSISSAYVSINEISGGIPKCLWSMPKLQVLHLSGNSLTGSLPNNITSTLVDLYLSHNVLTGSIPSYMQQRTWKNIDLSHNRFYGSLLETFSNQSKNSSLSLNNNRLSGFIPTSLKYMKDIDILKGNFFECKYDRSDLPENDNNKDSYECGSNTFNIIYYIWLGILTIIIIAIVLLWRNRTHIYKFIPLLSTEYNIWKWLYMLEYLETCCSNEDNNVVNKIQMMSHFKQYNALIEMMLRFSWYCTVCIIVILMPIYCVLSYYYRTHKHEYAWTVSVIYLSGVTTFAITISILLLFIAMQILLFMYSMRKSKYDTTLRSVDNNNSIDNSDTIVNKNNNKWKVYCMYIIYISINLIIISGINTAYVLVVLYKSNTLVILATIAIAIFKVVWNNIISAMILRWVITYLSFINTTNQTYRKRLFMMQLVVSLLNNILIPCFIVAIISPNCFYYIIRQEKDVSTSSLTSKTNCFDLYNSNICTDYIFDKLTTSYSPPFTYSYQCSAGFITYYAPVFVLMCIISTFIYPWIELIMIQWSIKYTWISKYYLELGKLFLPINNEIVSPLIYRDQIYTFFISQLTLLGLLLTFGTIFPPLAVALLITIAIRLCFHKATIARYIVKAIELKVYSCLDIIEDDCKVIPSFLTIQKCGFVILSTSTIFYTLFLFDALGDKVGLNKAYWVLIVMPNIPICLYAAYRLYVYLLKYKKKRNADSLRITTASAKYEISNIYKNNIELSTTTTSVALMTSNPLLVMNTNTTTIEEGRDSIIRDLSVSDREDISIITTD